MPDNNNKNDELEDEAPMADMGEEEDESEWEDSTGDEDPEEDF